MKTIVPLIAFVKAVATILFICTHLYGFDQMYA